MSATHRSLGDNRAVNQTFQKCKVQGFDINIQNKIGKSICTWSSFIPDTTLPWYLKYSKNSVSDNGGGKGHEDFGIQTRIFFDHDNAWNGLVSWDLECRDHTVTAQKIAKVFSWLIIVLSTIPSFLAIPIGIWKKEIGSYVTIATNCLG